MLKPWLVNAVFLLVVLVALFIGVWFLLPFMPGFKSRPRIANTPELLLQVKGLSQLVTVKYVIEKVIILEDVSHWYELQFGESRLLMVAHGIVKAGVNLDELKPEDFRVSGKKVKISLPPSRITDAYLDDRETRVIDRKTGLLRSFDKDLEQNARVQAVEDINRAARNNGIIKDADERARLQLEKLFRQMGFEEVEINTR
jgi:hypothetical protein